MYKYVYAPGHPLAQRQSGQVLEHRKVLYDRLGPGSHPCHFCHVPLTWERGTGLEALRIEHLNWDRMDNRPENLVAVCSSCNSTHLHARRKKPA
jgi:hypothetical protein